ncbi:Transmembrane protease serine 6 [Orchesella cincta]|uniref:Transmembrane protease serine 6 n=1 Tax=Orchesella cincta TaxID=48709 RepID=A0A1D2MVR0_ORCCI|nr:Transmembrane protease serine 6 [Orchesella cincta]
MKFKVVSLILLFSATFTESAILPSSDVFVAQMSVDVNTSVVKKREMPAAEVDENGRFVGLHDDGCTESFIITPIKTEAEISPDKSVLKESGSACHWNIIGTENCIPTLECDKFLLEPGTGGDDPCPEEYLQVTDGHKGFEKFCGKDGPKSITSGKKLRDLYITLKTSEQAKIKKRELRCQVTCHPGEAKGKPLAENSEPETDDTCNCGRKPNIDRIVGGEEAKKGEFPWIAALVTAGTRKPFCGGTIINNLFILTAAHVTQCFKGPYKNAAKNMEILLNAHNLDMTSVTVTKGENLDGNALPPEELKAADEQENSIRFSVNRYFIHPLYVRQTNDFDVALIKLDRPIDFKTLKGASALVAGWGLNSADATSTMSKLQKLDVKVFTNDECKTMYDSRFTRRMMCAGFREAGKDSCKGDSGGPLISEKSKQLWELIGVVSWGNVLYP